MLFKSPLKILKKTLAGSAETLIEKLRGVAHSDTKGYQRLRNPQHSSIDQGTRRVLRV